MNIKQTLKKSILVLLPFALLASCNTNTPSSTSSADETSENSTNSSIEEVDYVHNGSVQLKLEYSGHDFYADGIGQMTLKSPIDGDTAHFTPVVASTVSDETLIKARFWGIDTPESTGQIQEYGQAASNFTKAKLKEADENGTIVVSSPTDSYGKPSHDSTGTRYVSLVWVNLTKKNAPISELYLLNLWIVQDGFSWVKNVSDIPSYSDTFYAAQTQAKNLKLNMFSGLPDPLFNYGSYVNVSLLELKQEIAAKIADPTHVNKYDGQKVTVSGTVAGVAKNVLYLEAYFDSSTGSTVAGGEYAGINIYTGAAGGVASKFTSINAYIKVSGVAQDSDTFGFQITGALFPKVPMGADGEAEVLIKAEDNTDEHSLKYFEYKSSSTTAGDYTMLKSGDLSPLFCAVHMHDTLYVYGGYDSDNNGEHTLYCSYDDENGARSFFSIYVTFTYKPDADDPNYSFGTYTKFVGHTFTVSGIFGYHITSSNKVTYQILPRNSEDLVMVK